MMAEDVFVIAVQVVICAVVVGVVYAFTRE